MLKNNLFVRVALGSLLLIFLRIELVFSDLLPTGGDMGAHIVPTKFFVTELFNNFKLSGWSQDWFCLLYTSPSPRDSMTSRMPSSA